MEDLTIFSNPQFGQIRTMTDSEGEPWFCASDLCKALAYRNARDTISRHVDEGDVVKHDTPTSSGIQSMTFVNESGLYALIFGSKLERARQFKRWVTSEVLPAIRRHGSYSFHGDCTDAMSDEETVRRAFVILNLRLDKLTGEKQDLSRQVEELKPKADYCDRCLQSSECLTTTQVAKSIGMTGPELYGKLLSRRILYQQSGQYMPYARYARMGLTSSRTQMIPLRDGRSFTRQYLVWTEKGARFLRDMFRQMELPLFGF